MSNQISIDIVELTDENLYFYLKGTNMGVANALRRIILADVFTYAIDDVYIKENSSLIFNNDYIKQRLGLLVIDSNNRRLISKFPNECLCENKKCNQCSIVLTIDVTADYDKQSVVTTDIAFPMDCEMKFINGMENIPILKLMKNEHFKAELVVRKGTGSQHAKWMPSDCVIVKNKALIFFDNDSNTTMKPIQAQKFVKICPKKIFSIKDGTENQIVVQREDQCIYCKQCSRFAIEEMKNSKLVNVTPQQDVFVIQIESIGNMVPHLIFTEAIKILKSKVNDIQIQI